MVVVQPTKKGEKMWTDNLRQFHFWCQKTLPLVYDDSLSYYEVLAKVTKHLNELTTLVNEIGDELERYEGVTDNRLDTLETWRTEVDTWRTQIDQWKTIVENWREDVDQWREDINLWKTSINNWKVAVDAELESLDNRLDTAESDIDSLEGRMDTAEDDIDNAQSDITNLDGRLDDVETDGGLLKSNSYYFIKGSLTYDSGNNKWCLDIPKPLSDPMIQYIINGIEEPVPYSVFNGNWSPRLMFLISCASASFDYSSIYLRYYTGTGYTEITKNTHPILMTLVEAYAHREFVGDIMVRSDNNGKWYQIVGCDEYKLPNIASGDGGKVVMVSPLEDGYILEALT